MKRSMQFNFFATKDDLLPGILAFEAEHRVQYVLWGLHDSPSFERYPSVTDIPDLGQSLHGHRAAEKKYSVLPADAEVKVKPVPQRRGGTKYEVDLTSICRFAFSPGGVYGDRFVIDGSVGVNIGNEASITLCKEFIKKLRKGWTRIESYYVGSQALQLMKEGYRLTMSTQTPESSDLRLPSDASSRKW
jgi:hypothetical protein